MAQQSAISQFVASPNSRPARSKVPTSAVGNRFSSGRAIGFIGNGVDSGNNVPPTGAVADTSGSGRVSSTPGSGSDSGVTGVADERGNGNLDLNNLDLSLLGMGQAPVLGGKALGGLLGGLLGPIGSLIGSHIGGKIGQGVANNNQSNFVNSFANEAMGDGAPGAAPESDPAGSVSIGAPTTEGEAAPGEGIGAGSEGIGDGASEAGDNGGPGEGTGTSSAGSEGIGDGASEGGDNGGPGEGSGSSGDAGSGGDGGTGGDGGAGGDGGGGGDGWAMGGEVTADRLHGPDPAGPDEGYGGLQPGEFVVNQNAAQQNMPELQAINSGVPGPGQQDPNAGADPSMMGEDPNGGGDCFITEAVMASGGQGDDAQELQVLRQFRDQVLMQTPEGQAINAEYKAIAPVVVDAIMQRDDALDIFQQLDAQYIAPAVQFIQGGDYNEALKLYAQMIGYVTSLAVEGGGDDDDDMDDFGTMGAMMGHDNEAVSQATGMEGGEDEGGGLPMGGGMPPPAIMNQYATKPRF